MHSPSFDCGVVGSSPLLLAMALRLRSAGRSVVLFEQEHKLGGAWQVEDVAGIGTVECACHLLEWYAGGYELLTRLTGAQFVPSDPQPVRVFRNGKIAPYTSRFRIAWSLFWTLASVAAAVLRLGLAPNDRSSRKEHLAASWHALMFELRYRLPGIILFDKVRRPAKGYTGFMDDLRHEIEVSGTELIAAHVSEIDIQADHAVLRHDGKQTKVSCVILGESSLIDNLDRGGLQLQEFHHIVVAMPAKNVTQRNDYVHLPDDPLFHRITYVRDCTPASGEPSAIFLIQLRQRADRIASLDRELDDLLCRSGIVKSAAGLVVHKVFSRQYMERETTGSTLWSGSVVYRLRTVGDLSRNAVLQSALFDSLMDLVPAANANATKPVPSDS